MFWQRSVCVSEYFIHYHLSFHDMCLFMPFRGVAQFIIHKWRGSIVTFCEAFLKELFDIGKDVVGSPLDVDHLGLELFNDWLGVVCIIGQPLFDGVSRVVEVTSGRQSAGEDLL